MFGAIFRFLFGLIAKVGDFVLSPVYGLIDSIIPNSAELISNMFSFLEKGVGVLQFLCQNLLIPQFALFALVTYICGKYTFSITLNAVKFVINLYNKLKL